MSARGSGATRQRARRLVLLVSFLLFPVTIFYFSPVLIIEGALSGAVVASALVFATQFLMSLVLRRAFCGWLCAAGGGPQERPRQRIGVRQSGIFAGIFA